jgi:hypothetical protein
LNYRKEKHVSGDRKELADLLSRAAACIEDPDSLIRSHREELVEDLLAAEAELRPEPPITIEGETVKLNFNPQAWLNDYAISVDPQGDTVWEVPKDEFLKQFPTDADFISKHQERDDLRHEGSAPQWVRDWSGPFEVDLIDCPWEY